MVSLARQYRPGLKTMKNRWIKSILYFALWTIPGLLNLSQTYVSSLISGTTVPLLNALIEFFPSWYFWAFFTPAILWFGRKYTLSRRRWIRALAFHLPVGIAVGLLHVAFSAAMFKIAASLFGGSAPFQVIYSLLLQRSLHVSVLTYGAVLGFGYAFDYYNKLRERELQASQLESQLARAQLQALKAQLHPHFLFNTLHTIAVLARKNRSEQVVEMIARLSDLLRYSLEKASAQEVTLKREMEILELYLQIEQVRFQDRLKVEITMAPETMAAQVPGLILQPLAENAVRHGIARRSAAGKICINAWKDNGRLWIEVRDDGPGLKSSSGNGEPLEENDQRGIGLSNTRARLKTFYGEEHEFTLANAPEGGTLVRLVIPFRPANDGEAD